MCFRKIVLGSVWEIACWVRGKSEIRETGRVLASYRQEMMMALTRLIVVEWNISGFRTGFLIEWIVCVRERSQGRLQGLWPKPLDPVMMALLRWKALSKKQTFHGNMIFTKQIRFVKRLMMVLFLFPLFNLGQET